MPEATEEDTAPATRTTSWFLAWVCGWPLVLGGTAAYLAVYWNHLPNIYGACAAALAEIGVALLVLLLPSSGHIDYGGRLRSHWPTGFLGGAAVLAGVAFAAGQIIPPAGDKTEITGAFCARPANAVRAPL